MNFWKDLPKPFTVLAPLDGVTDVVFRQIITEIGKPDVLFTEFTMCHGLLSPGRRRVEDNLLFTKEQQPIVAQIWGINPEHFYKVAQDLVKRGFAGIDINMGCPEKTVIKEGACSGLIKNPKLAAEIIQATKDGAAGKIPVSVKTRIGFGQPIIEEWLGTILKQDIATLTIHLRTVAEMSRVPAHWEFMSEIIKLRDSIAPQTLIVGNGDVTSLEDMKEKYETYGCDGFMVGRGIFANPWLFNPKINMLEKTVQERINLYLHHIDLFEKQWKGKNKNFALLKKFGKTYISNFPNSSEFRDQLMQSRNIEELKEKLQKYQAA
jgi:tRNA-dihydrouridine synthase